MRALSDVHCEKAAEAERTVAEETEAGPSDRDGRHNGPVVSQTQ